MSNETSNPTPAQPAQRYPICETHQRQTCPNCGSCCALNSQCANHIYIEQPTQPATPRLYRKKPVDVEARQITVSEVVLTAHGRVRAEPGDWILRNPITGDTWPIKPDIFKDTYEPV
jgi:hypothetical protein